MREDGVWLAWRERLLQWAVVVVGSLIAALAARWGVDVPPLPIPIRLEVQPSEGSPAAPPVSPPAVPPDTRKPDPTKAVGRLLVGTSGCSCTVIGDRRSDGTHLVASAAHCVSAIGDTGRVVLGSVRFGVRVVAMDKSADIAWLVSDGSEGVVPFAVMAGRSPGAGTRIWHQGFGVDVPGNREEGSIVFDGETPDGQLRMMLSVSSGDSGGGIFRVDTGEWVSCVCCTRSPGNLAGVFGCSVERARRIMPTSPSSEFVDWKPLPVPVK